MYFNKREHIYVLPLSLDQRQETAHQTRHTIRSSFDLVHVSECDSTNIDRQNDRRVFDRQKTLRTCEHLDAITVLSQKTAEAAVGR